MKKPTIANSAKSVRPGRKISSAGCVWPSMLAVGGGTSFEETIGSEDNCKKSSWSITFQMLKQEGHSGRIIQVLLSRALNPFVATDSEIRFCQMLRDFPAICNKLVSVLVWAQNNNAKTHI